MCGSNFTGERVLRTHETHRLRLACGGRCYLLAESPFCSERRGKALVRDSDCLLCHESSSQLGTFERAGCRNQAQLQDFKGSTMLSAPHTTPLRGYSYLPKKGTTAWGGVGGGVL